jgi:hypothetical protein
MNEVPAVVAAIASANLRGNGARWQRWAVWKNLRTLALVQGMEWVQDWSRKKLIIGIELLCSALYNSG